MIGYHVRSYPVTSLLQPNVSPVSDTVGKFLDGIGLKNSEATVVPIGAAAGGPGLFEAIDPFMKVVGYLSTLVKFLLAWRARVTTLARRRLRPAVTVTLLADHVPPRPQTATASYDTASLIATFLPELLGNLQDTYPSFNITINVRARALSIGQVDIQVGNGLDLTDQHVMKIIKWLQADLSSMTIRHRENWLSLPTVKKIRGMALSARSFSGRPMVGGG
ncbi:hypothetical protein [Arthrobacter sp. EPSL27]|uniref:hypothetical protein n=1 Tax=Arthrobacter sp. EPSL27 TaxID=1745378 RepID=UPI0018D218A9|nr:hypothetical protein [Arthrobacter sp. EPSL27]